MARTYSAGSASVDISPEFSGFVTKLRAELERVDASIEIPVSADTTRARADLEEFRRTAGGDVTMNVGVDMAGAVAQTEAFREEVGRDIDVKINADTSALRSVLSELGTAGVLNVGAVGVGNLPAVASALAGVASSVQEVSQTALLLPGIFAGAGAGISTLVVGLQGFKDALGDNPKKAAAAFDQMAASARDVVTTTRSFDDELKNVEKTVQGTLFDGVAGPLRQAISNDIPALEGGMNRVAGSFNTGIKTALAELGNDKSQSALSTLFGNTATAAGNLNGAIVPAIDSLRTLGTTGSTFLPELAQGFTNLATRFDGFIDRSQQSGDLSRWMREGIDAAKELGSIVANLGSSLSSVLRAAHTDGDGFLTTVDHLTERMATWLKSTEGQTELRSFFADGRQQLDGWRPVLEELPGLLRSVYDGVSQWSGITMPFLRAAAQLLGDHPQLVRDVVAAYLAFKTVAPVMDGVRLALQGAESAAGNFRRGARSAADDGAGRLGSAMGGVSTLIGSALGGPWGLAIGAATLGLGALVTAHEKAQTAADNQRASLEALQRTLDKQTGKPTQQTVESITGTLNDQGLLERAKTLGVDTQQYARAASGVDPAGKDAINARITGIILEQMKKDPNNAGWLLATQQAGLSDRVIAQALQGIPSAVQQYSAATKDKAGVPDLAELKREIPTIAESAATLGGALNATTGKIAEARENQLRYNEALGKMHLLTTQGKQDFEALGISMDKVTVQDGKTVIIDTPTDEQRAKLETLGHIVETLPDKSIRLELDDEKARAGIAEIVKPATKQVTIEETYRRVQQGIDNPDVRNNSGPYSPESGYVHYATGGEISGGIPGVDSVPILGMPGEHMLDTEDVERMGGQAGVYRFRAALKAGLVRGMASGGAVGWTNEDEQQLQRAIQAQQKAEKDQADSLRFKKDLTDDDRRQMQQQVDEARQKVTQLQQQKAGGGKTPTKELPQIEAPGFKSEKQINIENAEMAVDEANTKRNQIYANPNSTDNDKRRADNDYLASQRQLRSAQKSKDKGDLPEQYTLPGIEMQFNDLLLSSVLGGLGVPGLSHYINDYNTVTAFLGKKAQEDADEADSLNTGYTPKNLPVEDQAAKEGGLYTGPGGYQAYASGHGTYTGSYVAGEGVEQWRPTFASVLSALGMPSSWLGLGLAQMQTESGGNPKAINLSDSNAAKGTPSKGLMQVIDPTFAAYRSGLYPNDIWDPNANIAAALRYTVDRYGGPEGVWGQGHGYADGGWITGIGGPRSDSNRIRASVGEFMVNAEAAAANGPLLEAINAGLVAAPLPLPQGIGSARPEPQTVHRDHSVQFNAPVHVMDMDHLVREQDRWAGIQSQGALVTY